LKIQKILLVLLLSFSSLFAISPNNGSANAASKPVKGAIIKSTYGACGGTRCFKSTIVDLYMKPKEARKFASKTEASLKEGVAWLGAGFIPGAGPYITIIGFVNTSYRADVAAKIRKFTDKNQSVHVYYIKAENQTGFTGYTVEKWNGKKSSIKPWKAPVPDWQHVTYKKYKY